MLKHLIVVLVTLALVPTSTVLAFNSFDEVCNTGGGTSAVCQDKNNTEDPVAGPNGIIKTFANIIAVVAGIAATALIVVGGIMYITSGGDSAKTQKARSTIIGAALGLAIVLFGWVITSFVVDKFIS